GRLHQGAAPRVDRPRRRGPGTTGRRGGARTPGPRAGRDLPPRDRRRRPAAPPVHRPRGLREARTRIATSANQACIRTKPTALAPSPASAPARARRRASVPFLQARPERPQRDPQPAADEDRVVLLGHAPGMEVLARLLDRGAEPLQALPVVLQDNEDVATEVAGPPQEVALVRADGPRQPVARTEERERPRLPVVVREDP